MGSYENGAFTRRAIVDACKKLFYEKGYHETSYADICEEAHVNRGTIYYHFPTKEDIRFEVQWEYYISCKHTAEQYGSDEQYLPLLTMVIFLIQGKNDSNMRRFMLQSCIDYPVFTNEKDLTHLYYVTYTHIWARFWDKERISTLAFATVYGYILSSLRLLYEYPDQYNSFELLESLLYTCLDIWGAPNDFTEELVKKVRTYIAAIPKCVWKTKFFNE